MHTERLTQLQHEHSFGQEHRREAERRTLLVVVLTSVMMVGEIVAGLAFGSMALLADGLHMGSHAVALGISLFAYVYARRRAHDKRFSFGTGKVNALGGFAGALLLGLFAIFMAYESVDRFIHPVAISFDQALLVAGLGLVVNIVSAFILKVDHHDGHAHHGHAHDHSLRSAYLHVLADALTSVLAIIALLAGKHYGQAWMDPAMGIVGAALITKWSWGLIRDSSHVLLDHQAPASVRQAVCDAIEAHGDDRVSDLHLWAIGPGIWAAEICVVTSAPREPDAYKAQLPADLGVVHTTVEVHECVHTETQECL